MVGVTNAGGIAKLRGVASMTLIPSGAGQKAIESQFQFVGFAGKQTPLNMLRPPTYTPSLRI